jgi:prephenate dehydrogenase
MGLTHPRVGIVGGTGRMGSWLALLLEARGLAVLRTGRKTDLTPSEMAQQCDVVVISVPIADTVRVIKEIGPLVSENGLLMDLTSVKKAPVEAMLKYSRAEVVGVHPLFGPDSGSNSDLRIAVCPGRGHEGPNWVIDTFRDEGFRVVTLEPEEHDRIMGIVQGVNHFSTLALALCISRSGIETDRLMNVSTYTFNQRLGRIRSIVEQPGELFGSLLMDNPAAGDFIERYLESVESLIQVTRKGDRKAFGELFHSLKKVFGASA